MAKDEQETAGHNWRPETALVHGGVTRSQYGETAEGLFLTQGFVYNSAEQAEARFKQEDPGFQYTRFGNPTIQMFEDRLRISKAPRNAALQRRAWPQSRPRFFHT